MNLFESPNYVTIGGNVKAVHYEGFWYYFAPDGKKIGKSKLLESSQVFLDGPVRITVKEWETLNENQKEFLRQAQAGCMSYLIHEQDGYPYAWGVAIAGLFDLELHVSENEHDGYIVMLREDYDKLP